MNNCKCCLPFWVLLICSCVWFSFSLWSPVIVRGKDNTVVHIRTQWKRKYNHYTLIQLTNCTLSNPPPHKIRYTHIDLYHVLRETYPPSTHDSVSLTHTLVYTNTRRHQVSRNWLTQFERNPQNPPVGVLPWAIRLINVATVPSHDTVRTSPLDWTDIQPQPQAATSDVRSKKKKQLVTLSMKFYRITDRQNLSLWRHANQQCACGCPTSTTVTSHGKPWQQHKRSSYGEDGGEERNTEG